MRVSHFFAAAALVAAAVLFSGCRSERVTAPEGATITVTATPSSISSLGGVSRIDVLVLNESGEPAQEDTEVFLTTDLGVLERTALKTDSSGRASTNLRAGGAVGTAKVKAVSGSATAAEVSVTILDESTLLFDGDSLRADPAVLDAASDGVRSSSTIHARLRRQDGTSVAEYPVTVDLAAASVALRLDQSLVTTDSAGRITVGVHSADAVGVASIRLSCVECAVASVGIELRDSPGRVEVRADKLSLEARNETQTVALVGTVFGKVSKTAMVSEENVTVVFSTAGPGGFVSGTTLTTSLQGPPLDSTGSSGAVLSLTAAEQASAKSSGEPIVIEVEATGFDGTVRSGTLAVTVR